MLKLETKVGDKWYQTLDLKQSGVGPRPTYRTFESENEAIAFAKEFLGLNDDQFRITDIENDTATV